MGVDWIPHVTVAAVIERNGRFLLVEEIVGGRLVLNQPAGHWEQGESLLEAVVRETREETAYRFVPDALLGIYQWKHPRSGATYLRFAFCGEVVDHDRLAPLDADIQRAVWMTTAQIHQAIDRLRSPQVLAAVKDHGSGKRFPLACLKDLNNPNLSNQRVTCVNNVK